MRPMMPDASVCSPAMLPAAIAILLTATTLLVAVPGEPDAIVLAEGAIYQAAAADLDGDGVREVVVLEGGDGDGSVTIAAWGVEDGRWSAIARPITGLAPAAPATPEATGPVRLLVRQIEGVDRVTVLRQPPRDVACCLVLHDLVLAGGALGLRPVAAPAGTVDAAWVIDLDGDGTDELVLSRSVPPLGDVSYPTDAHLHRWTGTSFSVTSTRLPAGSGNLPFLLGDSDGRPGDELAILATLGRRELHRVSLHPDGTLVMEDAGVVAQAVTAVQLNGEAGIAVLTIAGDLALHRWPFEADLEAPVAERFVGDGTLLGTVDIDGMPRLAVRRLATPDRLDLLGLPDLAPPRSGAVTPSPAAAAFRSGPVAPYVGPLPGGGADGEPAVIFSGRLLSGAERPGASTPIAERAIAALVGAEPIGLVGEDAVALFHAVGGPSNPGALGGLLEPPRARPDAMVSVAPLAVTLEPERDAGILVPPAQGAVALDDRGTIAVGAGGFTFTLTAPPGSGVHVAGTDPSVPDAVLAVPDDGSLVVPMPPPPVATPDPRYRAIVGVTTPGGHSYLASWDVHVLTRPPPLAASASTPLGSERVDVSGGSTRFAKVRVAGREVGVDADGRFSTVVAAPPWPTDIVVTAVDPLGNEARVTVTAIGWIDYRQLPWGPVAVSVVGGAAVLLALRVPRSRPVPRRADDDAMLEELEPD
jgi:hypothetical protein